MNICLSLWLIFPVSGWSATEAPPTSKSTIQVEQARWFDERVTAVRQAFALVPFVKKNQLDAVEMHVRERVAQGLVDAGHWLALEMYVLNLDRLERLIEKEPAEPRFKAVLARNYRGIANLARGTPERQLQLLDKAVKFQREAVALAPESPKFLAALATFLSDRGDVSQHDDNQVKDAQKDYTEAIQLWQKLLAGEPKTPSYRVELAYAWNGIGGAHLQTRENKEAKAAYEQAFTLREQLAKEFPSQPHRWTEVGGSACNIGNAIVEERKDLAAALHWFDRAIELLDRANRDDRNSIAAEDYLANAHWGRFLVHVRMKQFKDANDAFEASLKWFQPQTRIHRRIHRTLELAEAGDHQLAVKELDVLHKDEKLDLRGCWISVCAYSAACKSAGDDDKRVNDYSRKAINVLNRLRDQGNFPQGMLAAIRNDPLFDSLRSTEAYREFAKQLENEPTKSKE